jgi:rubrerythrin
MLVLDAEISTRPIYHLDGGMLAWDGRTLTDYPRVALFEGIGDDAERLVTAMNLEKGAWRFYTHVAAQHSGAAWVAVFANLVAAETAHARFLYNLWAPHQYHPPSFEDLFAQLNGEILEGGANLAECLQRIDTRGEAACLNLVETALDIECAAFDLYRFLAESQGPASAVALFRKLAQAEKDHIRQLGEATAGCPDIRRP